MQPSIHDESLAGWWAGCMSREEQETTVVLACFEGKLLGAAVRQRLTRPRKTHLTNIVHEQANGTVSVSCYL